MRHFSTKTLVLTGVFIALTIIFTHIFAIQTPFIRIDFGFLPIAVYAMILGPIHCALMAAVADILGCILLVPGLYFPGFTISSFFNGLILGFFLHKKNLTLKKIFLCFFITFLLIDTILNTLWLSILYNKAASAFIWGRLIKSIIFLPIHSFLCYLIYKTMKPYIK
ncbi:folate family ECF transporter S component [Pectinatus sottacetonis]|uniref:folate family ECF transporter S component n=1 Tax=Pectinatus sottacetonis TaxID=1002795 RepID=UPI0018C4E5DA|nr:folate family ECF transporter S component [Pectinatus sottacetonis]